jgi:hypothetical protein
VAMPGFVPSPETVRVLMHWSIHTRPQLNVLHGHFSTVGPVNPASAQNIFNALVGSATTAPFFTNLASTTRLDAVGIIDLRNDSVPEVKSTGSPILGTSVGTPLPDQVSLVLTLRTGKTGRSHRGRIYTLGWITGVIDNAGLFGSAQANEALAWYQALRTAMAAEGMPLAIRSPALPERPAKPGGMLPAKPFEITPVTAIEIRDLIPDTNRRRTDLLRR